MSRRRARHNFPRPPNGQPDILGAIYGDGSIFIDKSLDPEENPEQEGRYHFTLAHEGGGHWRLHQHLIMQDTAQTSFLDAASESKFICRSSEAKERVEWQGPEQKVTVEHVHVHAGGQAVVGTIERRGVGIRRKRRNNPMQSRLPMHLSPRCGTRTRKGAPCRSPARANGRCRMHGGTSPGAPIGNAKARKHGLYTADAIAERRDLAALLRTMRGIVDEVDG